MIGLILLIIGMLAAFVGGIWLLVVIFKESVLWGVLSLIFGPVSLVFVVMHWDISKKPFLIQIAGIVIAIIGAVIMGPMESNITTQ